MRKWIETTGRSEEDAIAAALFQLGLDRDSVSVKVIERAKSGFLGFGGNPARVRVSYGPDDGTGEPEPAVKEPEIAEEPDGAKEQEKQETEVRPEPVPRAPEKVQAAGTPAPEDDERARRIREFLTGLMAQMEIEATPEVSVDDEGSYLVVL